MSHKKRLHDAWFNALRPPPRLSLADWIEANLVLPQGVAAVPGPIRLYPFQREIADAIGDPDIERVTLVKPVRVGFTTLLTGALAGYVANDPSPVLALLPTERDCRDYMVSDVEPTFDASPALAGLLSASGRESRNTILSRRFPGGSLKVVAAKAPRNLRRHNARVLFIDEVDAMEITAEGPPILLAEKRTLSFPDRKIVIGSTPTFEESSAVLRSYAQSDMRVYEVRCPHCGEFHQVLWKDIRWPEGRPEEARWACPGCGCYVDESQKAAMVAAGRWRATRPEVKGHAGFRLSALISPLENARWGVLAKEFRQARDDPARLQAFTNTILAEGWRSLSDELDQQDLRNRAEPFGLDRIPAEVLAITVGVDVQNDRLEVTLIGWSETGVAYVLGHEIIWWPYDNDRAWTDLHDFITKRWPHPLGGAVGVDACCIDSGFGNHMAHVYRFAFPRARRGVMAIKGMPGHQRPPIEPSKSAQAGGKLWIVGVDTLKFRLFQLLAGNTRALRFSVDLPATWFEQLCSERLITRYAAGQPHRRFERIPGMAAEALDCTVYAIAAHQLIRNKNWARRRDELSRASPLPSTKPRPRVIESEWINS